MTNLAGRSSGAIIVLFLREQPMRETFEVTEVASDASAA
jgi:hypothetical protein